MHFKDTDCYTKRRLLGLGFLLSSLVLVLSVFLEDARFINYDRAESGIQTGVAVKPGTVIQDHENIPCSFSAANARVSTYRKKFQRIIYASFELLPFEKELEFTYPIVFDTAINYNTPHFRSAQHSFLYRLTFF